MSKKQESPLKKRARIRIEKRNKKVMTTSKILRLKAAGVYK
jgi:hypothetical protein